MTDYEFGDLVLVSFPFTDLRTTKKRPAVIVSSERYHLERPDVIILAVTSRLGASRTVREAAVVKWKEAGLLRPSVLKPLLATIERNEGNQGADLLLLRFASRLR